MKWYSPIIGILVIVLLVSIGMVVFSGENNQVDAEEQSKDLENVIGETGKIISISVHDSVTVSFLGLRFQVYLP